MGGLHPPKTLLLLRKLKNYLTLIIKWKYQTMIPMTTQIKKYKQLFPYMPADTFRMLICGNSGSGKTNLLYHMLIKPLLYYDEIYLYARNLEQARISIKS